MIALHSYIEIINSHTSDLLTIGWMGISTVGTSCPCLTSEAEELVWLLRSAESDGEAGKLTWRPTCDDTEGLTSNIGSNLNWASRSVVRREVTFYTRNLSHKPIHFYVLTTADAGVLSRAFSSAGNNCATLCLTGEGSRCSSAAGGMRPRSRRLRMPRCASCSLIGGGSSCNQTKI